jgi:hypothetical protein
MTASGARAGGGFSPAVVVALVLVGVLALGAVLVLSAYAPELRRDGGGREHALSRSAVGFGGAVALLKERGVRVVTSRNAHGLRSGVLVLTPTLTMSADDIADPWVGPALVILPKWRTSPHREARGWVNNEGLAEAEDLQAMLEKLAPGSSIRHGVRTPEVRLTAGAHRLVRGKPLILPSSDSAPPAPPPGGRLLFAPGAVLNTGRINLLQTLSGPQWIPVLTEPSGGAVLVKHRTKNVYVLSEPDLLNTHGLADFRNASAGMAILDAFAGPGEPVVFDLTLHGMAQERTLLRTALSPPFLGVTLCLAAAAVLMGLHAAARFGPSRRSERALALGKTALADNTAALIRLTRREPRMARGYAELVRAAAARAVGAPRDLGPDQLDGFLDRLSRRRGASSDFTSLAREAEGVTGREGLLRLARALHRWKTEITGEHR